MYKSCLAGNRIIRLSEAKSATRCFLGQKTGKLVSYTLKLGKSYRYNKRHRGISFGKRTGFSRNLPSQQSENIIYDRCKSGFCRASRRR